MDSKEVYIPYKQRDRKQMSSYRMELKENSAFNPTPPPDSHWYSHPTKEIDVEIEVYRANDIDAEWALEHTYQAKLVCVNDPDENLGFTYSIFEITFRQRPFFLDRRTVRCMFDGYSNTINTVRK